MPIHKALHTPPSKTRKLAVLKSEEKKTGKKLADLAVLSQDIFSVSPGAIGKTTVVLTMVGGKVIYSAMP